MDGAISFSGELGALIFLGTAILFLVVTLTTLAVHLVTRKSASGFGWPKVFLVSGLIVLIFDSIFFAFLVFQGGRVWSKSEAVAFDQAMFTIWIPSHFAAYFLLAFLFRFYLRRKAEIINFIDELR